MLFLFKYFTYSVHLFLSFIYLFLFYLFSSFLFFYRSIHLFTYSLIHNIYSSYFSFVDSPVQTYIDLSHSLFSCLSLRFFIHPSTSSILSSPSFIFLLHSFVTLHFYLFPCSLVPSFNFSFLFLRFDNSVPYPFIQLNLIFRFHSFFSPPIHLRIHSLISFFSLSLPSYTHLLIHLLTPFLNFSLLNVSPLHILPHSFPHTSISFLTHTLTSFLISYSFLNSFFDPNLTPFSFPHISISLSTYASDSLLLRFSIYPFPYPLTHPIS